MARPVHFRAYMTRPIDATNLDPELEFQRQTRALLETAIELDLSIVELVVAASECSDDAYEIDDLVDDLVDSGRIRIRRRGFDPMFAESL
jgi:hypothetical protein